MAKKYPQIGAMYAKKDRGTGKPILDKNNQQAYTIKTSKDVKLTVNGVPVEGYINVSRPRDKFDRMLEKGSITPKEHAAKVAQFEKGGDFESLKFEISCVIEE